MLTSPGLSDVVRVIALESVWSQQQSDRAPTSTDVSASAPRSKAHRG